MHEQAHLHIDNAIWEACKAGDKAAYAKIYILYYDRLYNYGCRFTSHVMLIEDSIQEIFMRFWTNREQLFAVRELRSYLFVSFRHCLLRLLSRQQQLKEDVEVEEENYLFALEMSAEQQQMVKEDEDEQLLALQYSLTRLTPRQKEAVFFRFYENMDYAEIAAILNISVKATYKLMARSIEVLREAYHTLPITSSKKVTSSWGKMYMPLLLLM
jgi:RNA polymerase sigma factor (sigma-70 family)